MTWRKYQGRIDPKRLVFIDETWTKTNMAPLRGWGPRGSRVKGNAPFGRWKTMTFIAALRRDGIAAPCLFDGPINGEVFLAWVRQILVPTLKPGEIVIMDNLGSHRGKAVRGAIRRPEPSSCSCPNTPPTSTRSSRSLQSSNTCSGRRRPALMTPCSPPLALFSKATLRKNAPTILQIADMEQANLNPL